MSAQELQTLLTMLRAGGPNLGASPAEARESFAALLDHVPVAADLACEAVDAGGVPSLWIDAPGARRDRVVVYLHGGGYVAGSAHSYRSLAGELGRAAEARTLAVDYRLSPEDPFPAPIDDALAVYRWLLARGIGATSIVFAGDSAGGGLTLTAMLAARDGGLPLPAAGLLISPWIDIDCRGASMQSKAAVDPSLKAGELRHLGQAYRGGVSGGGRGGLLEPLAADLSGLPPLLVQIGSSEILLDDATRLAERAGAGDVAIRLEVWPHMVHVWHMFGFMLGEGRDAIREAGIFLAAQMG
jgi:acetyl esterase/lipase